VIIESQARRISALTQSLRNLQRNARISRRADALRDELMAQIGALRLGLSSLDTEMGENLPGLTSLADSVRRVAAEAGALADAREELDVALSVKPGTSRPLPITPVTDPDMQRVQVGRRN
jgi:chromosome segregation ATPase